MIRSDASSSGDNSHLVLYTQSKMDGEVTGPRGAPPLVVLLSGHDLSVKFLSVFMTQKINAAASRSQRSLVGRAWGDRTNSKLVQVLRTFYC